MWEQNVPYLLHFHPKDAFAHSCLFVENRNLDQSESNLKTFAHGKCS
jgi:hypothetical protein